MGVLLAAEKNAAGRLDRGEMIQEALELGQVIRGDSRESHPASMVPFFSEREFRPDNLGDHFDGVQKGIGVKEYFNP